GEHCRSGGVHGFGHSHPGGRYVSAARHLRGLADGGSDCRRFLGVYSAPIFGADDHSNASGACDSTRSRTDARQLSEDAAAVPNPRFGLQAVHGFPETASLQYRLQSIPEKVAANDARHSRLNSLNSFTTKSPNSRCWVFATNWR